MKKNKPTVIFTMCIILILMYCTPVFAVKANQDGVEPNIESNLHEIDPDAEDIFDKEKPAAMKPVPPTNIVDDETKQQQPSVVEAEVQIEKKAENTTPEKKATSKPRAAGTYTFTITIPDEIQLGETNTLVQITASDVSLEPTAHITVETDQTIVLKNGSSELVSLVQGGILEFGDNVTREFEITKPTGLSPAVGTYTGVITFRVDYIYIP